MDTVTNSDNPFLEKEEGFLLDCMENNFEKIINTDIRDFGTLTIIDAISILINKNYKTTCVWLMAKSSDSLRVSNVFWMCMKDPKLWEQIIGRFKEITSVCTDPKNS